MIFTVVPVRSYVDGCTGDKSSPEATNLMTYPDPGADQAWQQLEIEINQIRLTKR